MVNVDSPLWIYRSRLEEIYVWCFVTLCVVAARFISRRLLGPLGRFRSDDWLMMFTVVLYLTTIGVDTAWVLYPNPADDDPNYNSIWAQIFTIQLMYYHFSLLVSWLCKGCMLIMVYRLTSRVVAGILIKIITGFVVISYFAILIIFLTTCRPLSQYIYDSNEQQCVYHTYSDIAIAALNSTTDLAILAVTIPLILRTNFPSKKKARLVVLFGAGIATVVITIMNRVWSLIANNSYTGSTWHIRECSMALIVTNLPLSAPAWQRVGLSLRKVWDKVTGRPRRADVRILRTDEDASPDTSGKEGDSAAKDSYFTDSVYRPVGQERSVGSYTQTSVELEKYQSK